MTVRRSRMLLWLTTVGLLAVAAAGVLVHLNTPVQLTSTPESASNNNGIEQGPDAELQRPSINVAELHQVASRDIRQQLFDPPVVVPPPPPPKTLPPIELLSTILRPNSQGGDTSVDSGGTSGGGGAWVRDEQTMRKVKVGDTIGPEDNSATVKAIKKDRLLLDHEGREVEVVQSQGGRR